MFANNLHTFISDVQLLINIFNSKHNIWVENIYRAYWWTKVKCSFRKIYRRRACYVVVAMIVFEFMTISLNDYLLWAVCLQSECTCIWNREVHADNVALLCEIWHTTRQTGAHAILFQDGFHWHDLVSHVSDPRV